MHIRHRPVVLADIFHDPCNDTKFDVVADKRLVAIRPETRAIDASGKFYQQIRAIGHRRTALTEEACIEGDGARYTSDGQIALHGRVAQGPAYASGAEMDFGKAGRVQNLAAFHRFGREYEPGARSAGVQRNQNAARGYIVEVNQQIGRGDRH